MSVVLSCCRFLLPLARINTMKRNYLILNYLFTCALAVKKNIRWGRIYQLVDYIPNWKSFMGFLCLHTNYIYSVELMVNKAMTWASTNTTTIIAHLLTQPNHFPHLPSYKMVLYFLQQFDIIVRDVMSPWLSNQSICSKK